MNMFILDSLSLHGVAATAIKQQTAATFSTSLLRKHSENRGVKYLIPLKVTPTATANQPCEMTTNKYKLVQQQNLQQQSEPKQENNKVVENFLIQKKPSPSSHKTKEMIKNNNENRNDKQAMTAIENNTTITDNTMPQEAHKLEEEAQQQQQNNSVNRNENICAAEWGKVPATNNRHHNCNNCNVKKTANRNAFTTTAINTNTNSTTTSNTFKALNFENTVENNAEQRVAAKMLTNCFQNIVDLNTFAVPPETAAPPPPSPAVRTTKPTLLHDFKSCSSCSCLPLSICINNAASKGMPAASSSPPPTKLQKTQAHFSTNNDSDCFSATCNDDDDDNDYGGGSFCHNSNNENYNNCYNNNISNNNSSNNNISNVILNTNSFLMLECSQSLCENERQQETRNLIQNGYRNCENAAAVAVASSANATTIVNNNSTTKKAIKTEYSSVWREPEHFSAYKHCERTQDPIGNLFEHNVSSVVSPVDSVLENFEKFLNAVKLENRELNRSVVECHDLIDLSDDPKCLIDVQNDKVVSGECNKLQSHDHISSMETEIVNLVTETMKTANKIQVNNVENQCNLENLLYCDLNETLEEQNLLESKEILQLIETETTFTPTTTPQPAVVETAKIIKTLTKVNEIQRIGDNGNNHKPNATNLLMVDGVNETSAKTPVTCFNFNTNNSHQNNNNKCYDNISENSKNNSEEHQQQTCAQIQTKESCQNFNSSKVTTVTATANINEVETRVPLEIKTKSQVCSSSSIESFSPRVQSENEILAHEKSHNLNLKANTNNCFYAAAATAATNTNCLSLSCCRTNTTSLTHTNTNFAEYKNICHHSLFFEQQQQENHIQDQLTSAYTLRDFAKCLKPSPDEDIKYTLNSRQNENEKEKLQKLNFNTNSSKQINSNERSVISTEKKSIVDCNLSEEQVNCQESCVTANNLYNKILKTDTEGRNEILQQQQLINLKEIEAQNINNKENICFKQKEIAKSKDTQFSEIENLSTPKFYNSTNPNAQTCKANVCFGEQTNKVPENFAQENFPNLEDFDNELKSHCNEKIYTREKNSQPLLYLTFVWPTKNEGQVLTTSRRQGNDDDQGENQTEKPEAKEYVVVNGECTCELAKSVSLSKTYGTCNKNHVEVSSKEQQPKQKGGITCPPQYEQSEISNRSTDDSVGGGDDDDDEGDLFEQRLPIDKQKAEDEKQGPYKINSRQNQAEENNKSSANFASVCKSEKVLKNLRNIKNSEKELLSEHKHEDFKNVKEIREKEDLAKESPKEKEFKKEISFFKENCITEIKYSLKNENNFQVFDIKRDCQNLHTTESVAQQDNAKNVLNHNESLIRLSETTEKQQPQANYKPQYCNEHHTSDNQPEEFLSLEEFEASQRLKRLLQQHQNLRTRYDNIPVATTTTTTTTTTQFNNYKQTNTIATTSSESLKTEIARHSKDDLCIPYKSQKGVVVHTTTTTLTKPNSIAFTKANKLQADCETTSERSSLLRANAYKSQLIEIKQISQDQRDSKDSQQTEKKASVNKRKTQEIIETKELNKVNNKETPETNVNENNTKSPHTYVKKEKIVQENIVETKEKIIQLREINKLSNEELQEKNYKENNRNSPQRYVKERGIVKTNISEKPVIAKSIEIKDKSKLNYKELQENNVNESARNSPHQYVKKKEFVKTNILEKQEKVKRIKIKETNKLNNRETQEGNNVNENKRNSPRAYVSKKVVRLAQQYNTHHPLEEHTNPLQQLYLTDEQQQQQQPQETSAIENCENLRFPIEENTDKTAVSQQQNSTPSNFCNLNLQHIAKTKQLIQEQKQEQNLIQNSSGTNELFGPTENPQINEYKSAFVPTKPEIYKNLKPLTATTQNLTTATTSLSEFDTQRFSDFYHLNHITNSLNNNCYYYNNNNTNCLIAHVLPAQHPLYTTNFITPLQLPFCYDELSINETAQQIQQQSEILTNNSAATTTTTTTATATTQTPILNINNNEIDDDLSSISSNNSSVCDCFNCQQQDPTELDRVRGRDRVLKTEANVSLNAATEAVQIEEQEQQHLNKHKMREVNGQLRGLLKKPNRPPPTRKNRVVFDETRNEFFEADYIILIREDCAYDEEDEEPCTCGEHELVRLCCEEGCQCNYSTAATDDNRTPQSPKYAPPIEFVDEAALSPPDGYKDNGLKNTLGGAFSGHIFGAQHLQQLQVIQRLQQQRAAMLAARTNSQIPPPPPPATTNSSSAASVNQQSSTVSSTCSSSSPLNSSSTPSSAAAAVATTAVSSNSSMNPSATQHSPDDDTQGVCTECAECAECAAKQLQQDAECNSPQCQEDLTAPLGVPAVALLPIHTSSPERRITQKEIIAGEERPRYVLQAQYKSSPVSERRIVREATEDLAANTAAAATTVTSTATVTASASATASTALSAGGESDLLPPALPAKPGATSINNDLCDPEKPPPIPPKENSPTTQISGILKGGKLWKQDSISQHSDDQNNTTSEDEAGSTSNGTIKRSVRFVTEEISNDEVDGQLANVDEDNQINELIPIKKHSTLFKNALRPNSAVQQLFPSTVSHQTLTSEALRAFDESKRAGCLVPTLPGSAGDSDTLRRSMERNILRRSLIKKKAVKSDISLEERIKQLTCGIDEDNDEFAQENGEDDNSKIEDSADLSHRDSPAGEENPQKFNINGNNSDKSFSPNSSVSSSSSGSSAYKKITEIFNREKKNQEKIMEMEENPIVIIPQECRCPAAPDLGMGVQVPVVHTQIHRTPPRQTEPKRQFLSTLAPLTACVAGNKDDLSSYYTLAAAHHNQAAQHAHAAEYNLAAMMAGEQNTTGLSQTTGDEVRKVAPDVIAGTPGQEQQDELAAFAQQEANRTDKIKKRYSNEPTNTKENNNKEANSDDDEGNDYGFNKRPSVRGIKPKFSSTNEILQQMQDQLSQQMPSVAHTQTLPQNMKSYTLPKQSSASAITKQLQQQQPSPQNMPHPSVSTSQQQLPQQQQMCSNVAAPAAMQMSANAAIAQQQTEQRTWSFYSEAGGAGEQQRLPVESAAAAMQQTYYQTLPAGAMFRHTMIHQHQQHGPEEAMLYAQNCQAVATTIEPQPHYGHYARSPTRRPESPPPLRNYHQTMVLIPYNAETYSQFAATNMDPKVAHIQRQNILEYQQVGEMTQVTQQTIRVPIGYALPGMQLHVVAGRGHGAQYATATAAQGHHQQHQRIMTQRYQFAQEASMAGFSERGVPEGAAAVSHSDCASSGMVSPTTGQQMAMQQQQQQGAQLAQQQQQHQQQQQVNCQQQQQVQPQLQNNMQSAAQGSVYYAMNV